jgi:hypothetical protein
VFDTWPPHQRHSRDHRQRASDRQSMVAGKRLGARLYAR